MIFCEVTIKETSTKNFASFVYCLNTLNERKLLWEELKNQESLARNLPRVVYGDFETIRKVEEKRGGVDVVDTYGEELNLCCNATHLEDLRFMGNFFT